MLRGAVLHMPGSFGTSQDTPVLFRAPHDAGTELRHDRLYLNYLPALEYWYDHFSKNQLGLGVKKAPCMCVDSMKHIDYFLHTI